MVTISQPRGQWVARVSGMGTLPVVCSCHLDGDVLVQSWTTREGKDSVAAQKQFDAVVGQLTAGNPDRKVRAVVVDSADVAKGAAKRLYEFTLANIKVNRFRNGTATYNYLLTDAQQLA